MAEMQINVSSTIYAEIVGGDITMLSNTSVILDCLSNSYSTFGKLTFCQLQLVSNSGLSDIRILNNGKNTRFSASGIGSCQVRLTIKDEVGNSDTDEITITVQ